MTRIINLNNGCDMPAFGFGTWLAAPGVVGQSIRTALENGYRHIDCAHAYGNEPEIGKVLSEFFSEGKIKREDVFITTKIPGTKFRQVEETCRGQLKDLQLDYVDLYLVHLPIEFEDDFVFGGENSVGVIGYSPDRMQEVWKSMESLVTKGLTKSIGVSNFTIHKLEELLKRSPTIKPVCNQVEVHPYLPQKRLRDYCQKQEIAVVAYAPIGSPGRPSRKADNPSLLEERVIVEIAKTRNVTVAQVLLSWNLTSGNGVIVKSVNESRIRENFGCLDLKMSADDMKAINDIKTRHRFFQMEFALKAGQPVEDIWDGEYLN